MAKQKQIKKTRTVTITDSLPLWQHKHFYKGLVLLFAFLLFVNSIPNDYNMDDELVTINHRLTSKGISAIPEIFTSPYYQDDQGYSYEYRPVVLASFAIEHQFFGDNPHVGHFFNVVLYALCGLALYLVLLRLFKNQSPLIPLAITLLFIAHPAHTEVVCSIKNRDEILGLLFSFLSMLVVLKTVQDSKKWMMVLVPLLFSMALMSKITVISFVILIPLALILFTEVGFSTVLLITLLLQIPSYFLLNLSSGFEKVMAQLGITTIVLVFYVIINFRSVTSAFKNQVAYVKETFFHKKESLFDEDHVNTEYGFKDIFRGIIPAKELFSFRPFLFTAALASLYLFLMHQQHSLYASLPSVALLLLAWKGERKISWWASVMMNLAFALNLYNLSLGIEHLGTNSYGYVYATVLAPYFVYQIIFGKRNLFIPTLTSFVIFNLINILWFRNWDAVLPVFAMLLFLNKLGRYAAMFFLSVSILIRYPFNQPEDITDLLQSGMGLAIVFIIHFKKDGKVLVWLLAAVSILLFHFNQVRNDKIVSIKNTFISAVVTANQISPKIISTIQDRPIQYVEECVSMKDPLSVRAGTSLEICFHYLQKVILPYPMAFYYGYKFIRPQKITDSIPAISFLLHLLLLIAAFLLLNRERVISYGLFTYLFSVIVFSNYFQFVPGMLADRFLLIPSLGWCIILVATLQKIFKIQIDAKAKTGYNIPSWAKYTFSGVLLFYSLITFSRNLDWKNDLMLFRHDIGYVEQSSQAHNLLAIHLMKQSDLETNPAQKTELENEALGHFKRAQEIYPQYFNVAFDIGRAYMALNMPDSAINAFKYTLTIDTSFRDVQRNIGQLLFQQGKLEEAIPYFENVIRYRPEEYTSYDILSYIYFKLNKVDKSIEVSRQAMQYQPSLPDPIINIGRVYQSIKQLDSARLYFQKANEVSPGNPSVQQLLQQVSAP